MTKLEAMEELTLLLNKTRSQRNYAYKMWGEASAHEAYDKEIALFEFLFRTLQDGVAPQAILEGEIIGAEVAAL